MSRAVVFAYHEVGARCLAVLGDDRANWRPDHFGYDLWGCRVSFQFPIVKLLDYAPQVAALESHPNPFAAVVLAHLKTRETRASYIARPPLQSGVGEPHTYLTVGSTTANGPDFRVRVSSLPSGGRSPIPMTRLRRVP